MEPKRPSAAERQREEREAAMRRRKTSVRLGTVGILLLFAGGIGVLFSPAGAVPLIGLMGTGLVLTAAAFLLVRTPMTELLRMPEE